MPSLLKLKPHCSAHLMPFLCCCQKSTLVVHHGSSGPAGFHPLLLQPGLREQPHFFPRLSCENCQISRERKSTQGPGHNSVHL